MVRWLRTRKASMLLWRWVDFIHADERESLQSIVNALQRNELPPPYLRRLVALDGGIVTVRIRLSRQLDIADAGPGDLVIGHVVRLSSTKEANVA